MKKPKKVKKLFVMTAPLARALVKYAKATGATQSGVVEDALASWLQDMGVGVQ